MQATDSFRDAIRSWPSLQVTAIGLLAITSVAMSGVIYAEITAPPLAMPAENAAPANAPRGRAAGSTAAPKFALPPLPSFSAVTDRPLFAQTRRPPPQGSNDAPGAWSAFVLAGIIISPTSREVLIIHGQPPALVHLQEGQDVEGWTVASIQADRIVLRGGDGDHELKLLDKPADNTTPPPVPAVRRFNR